MVEIIAVMIPIVFTLTAGAIIIYAIHTKNKFQQSVIEKGLVDENLKYLINPEEPDSVRYRLRYLRFGILILSVGVGILIGMILENMSFADNKFFGPAILICVGIGFIVYYFIEVQVKKKESK